MFLGMPGVDGKMKKRRMYRNEYAILRDEKLRFLGFLCIITVGEDTNE